uniref:Hmgi/y n=1 Tax=Arundo donax TaxID=35708 RepID=A0A0A9H4V5_ARUDO
MATTRRRRRSGTRCGGELSSSEKRRI